MRVNYLHVWCKLNVKCCLLPIIDAIDIGHRPWFFLQKKSEKQKLLVKNHTGGAIRKKIEQVLSTISILNVEENKNSCTSYCPPIKKEYNLKVTKIISYPRVLPPPSLSQKNNCLSHSLCVVLHMRPDGQITSDWSKLHWILKWCDSLSTPIHFLQIPAPFWDNIFWPITLHQSTHCFVVFATSCSSGHVTIKVSFFHFFSHNVDVETYTVFALHVYVHTLM